MKRFSSILIAIAPLALFTLLLLLLVAIREFEGAALPAWLTWAVGVAWALMAMDYLIRFEVLKQIGGLIIFSVGLLILVGALVPLEQVEQYPSIASDQLATAFESAWNAVYQGRLFEHFSPKQITIDFLRSLGDVNLLRGGKIIAFAVLGFLMGIAYLFPLNPIHPRVSPRHRFSLELYWRRFLFVATVGIVYATQVELLQVLSPTRTVTLFNMLENTLGIVLGLTAFLPVQVGYALLASHRQRGEARFNVLGVGVDAVGMKECIQRFEQVIETHHAGDPPVMTSALGVAGVIEARRQQRLQRILNESILNTPDGMPLVWLGKLFGYRQIERVYGPDLLREVCAYSAEPIDSEGEGGKKDSVGRAHRASRSDTDEETNAELEPGSTHGGTSSRRTRGWKHYFYGAAPGIVDKLKIALEKKFAGINIVGTYCPPFRPLTPEEEADLIADVERVKPDIFWIGISTPKQLYFMDQMRDKLACKIICPVGYAFDVNAGVESDAPEWIKFAGLQWLHRAIKQPRLWKRYLPDNPRFVWEALLQILHVRKYPMFLHECPKAPYTDAEGYPRFPAGVVSLSAMSLAGARDRILNWVKTGQKNYVNICTADTMVQCFDRPDLACIVQRSGMATTDGMPLVWLAKHFGFKDATRVYGPDLMIELCRASSEQPTPVRHYFYGATEDTLAKLKENLLGQFPRLEVVGMYAPPFRPLTEAEKDSVAKQINDAKPDIVWCGLGTPKQDYWVAEFRDRLDCAAILAVGAAFDFHAKRIRQAPRWMMNAGLEWLFRLYIEPRRLWRRYIIGNPRFILMILNMQLLPRSKRKDI